MRFLTMVMVTMLTGCSCGDVTVTPVGDTFEGTWAEEVARAAKEWTDVGCPIYVSDHGARVSIVPVADWRWYEGDGDPWWGHATDDNVYIRAGLAPKNRHKILLHEFGHLLGYGHTEGGIMRQHVAVDFVTADDCR